MSHRVYEEREQRRGLVLGLTLAEVLLLILFLLMLALGSRMEYWRIEAEHRQQEYNELVATHDSLRTIQAELVKNGAVDIKSVQELVTRLSRIDELERRLSELKQEKSSLSSQVVALKSVGPDMQKTLRDVSAALERAKQIDPNDPPALLRRALEIIERLGPSTQPEQVKPLSEMIADSELKKQVATLEKDRERMRQQLDTFTRSGNGLTYPPCWPASKGKTEYMFDVIAKDDGIVVRDAFLDSKKNDAAWKYVESFPRNVVISEKKFNEATAKILTYSNQNNCRFYIRLYDGTARESKVRYIHLRAAIAANFYLYPVISSQPPAEAPVALEHNN
jgi:uncharacterized coiled-coil protein SlyX